MPSPSLNIPKLIDDMENTVIQISQAFQSSITTAIEPIESLSDGLHELELKNLLTYYQTDINSKSKNTQSRQIQYLENKECCKFCNTIPYSLPMSAIIKNPEEIEFAKRLIDLQYRVCKHCKRLMPLSEINKAMKKPKRYVYPYCPCCNGRMVLTQVLIRRTKMRENLYGEEEGY